jgi:hypothetical protein
MVSVRGDTGLFFGQEALELTILITRTASSVASALSIFRMIVCGWFCLIGFFEMAGFRFLAEE